MDDTNFNAAFTKILLFEGGYSDNAADKGGKTKYGITSKTAQQVGYKGDIKELTLKEAKDIYRTFYWTKLHFNEISDSKTATELFDIAVNMGGTKACKTLQEGLNLLNKNQHLWADLVVDGIIGPKTLTTLNNLSTRDLQYLYKIINGLQFMAYYNIIKSDPSQETFFRGWLTRV